MITKFNTAQVAQTGSKGGSNAIIWIVLALGAGYLVYEYAYKPIANKDKQNA